MYARPVDLRAPPRRWGTGVVLSVAIGLGLVAGMYELHDPDVWWVAAAGRERLLHGAIPTTNLFSFTDPSHPWVMHEWLLAAPYAWMMGHLGPPAFALGAVLQLTAAVAIAARFFERETKSAWASVFLVATTLGLFGVRFLTIRPTHVALLLALAFATQLFRPVLGARTSLVLILLELVWTNLHGSFVVGVALAISAILVYPREWRLRGLTALLVLAVTLVNPYGLGLHRLALSYFLGTSDVYRAIHEHVADFAPITRLSPLDKPLTFLGLFVVVAAALFLATGRDTRARAVVAGALAVVAARNVRHVDLAGIVTMVLVAPRLDAWLGGLRRDAAVRDSRLLAQSTFVAGLLGFACASLGPKAAKDRFMTPDGTPGAAWVRALDRVPDGARLLVPFSAAGVAIWEAAPRGIRIFYDPRNDCYSADVAAAAFALEYPGPGDVAFLAAYGTTDVVLPIGHGLVPSLRASRRYAVAFENDRLVGFHLVPTGAVRDEPPATRCVNADASGSPS
jgi:hypothetical protein